MGENGLKYFFRTKRTKINFGIRVSKLSKATLERFIYPFPIRSMNQMTSIANNEVSLSKKLTELPGYIRM